MERFIPVGFAVTVMVLAPIGASAQGEDIAYMPREAPTYTADDATIKFMDRAEPGTVDLVLPAGTYAVDLLNAQGRVMEELDGGPNAQLDLRSLKPGTWTVRAHCSSGIRVRRFVVLGRGGTMWVDQRRPPVKRR